MVWSQIDFERLSELHPQFLRKPAQMAMLFSFLKPLNKLQEKTLYRMQHNGTTIYLEKLLNEYFQVPGYDTQHHDTTKRVYIGDIQETGALYIYQDQEPDVSFLQDEDSESDLFLDVDVEGSGAYSFTIFIPVGYAFQEPNLRAEIDSYRYFGKKYNIQTY